MTNYCYDMIGAYYSGVNKHPQQDMLDLGFNIVKCQCFPVGDCWYFRVDNEDEVANIPDYLGRHDDYKFPDEKSKEEIHKDMNEGKEMVKRLHKFLPQEATAIFKFKDEEVFRRDTKGD